MLLSGWLRQLSQAKPDRGLLNSLIALRFVGYHRPGHGPGVIEKVAKLIHGVQWIPIQDGIVRSRMNPINLAVSGLF